MMLAAYEGKLEIFRYLLEMGADIIILNNDNNPALHLAARWRSVDILKLLVDKGLSVNLTNKYGDTQLHLLPNLATWRQGNFWLKEVLLYQP